MIKREWSVTIVLMLLGLYATACTVVSASTSKPTAIITAPASNSEFRSGEPVTVQSTSTDLEGITRIELLVDGSLVRTEPSPSPQRSFTVVQTWTATPGAHLISVRAVNSAGVLSDPAVIQVVVSPASTPTPAATPTPTRAPAAACTNGATFVADVSIADGTVLAPGQGFAKIWRVRNSGTCAWGASHTLVFTAGEAMTTTTVIPVPNTAPGATADLAVGLTAPSAQGAHTGTWGLKSNGALFGPMLTVKINASAASTNPCPWTPVIESFTASPTTITAGQSATLNWGFVIGAERAEIDQGIGGVETPGSTTVSPATTTTYTLTATCQGKVRTAQVTINVVNP